MLKIRKDFLKLTKSQTSPPPPPHETNFHLLVKLDYEVLGIEGHIEI